MRKLFIPLVSILLSINLNAQLTRLQAESAFGGTDIEHAYSVHQTRDGGFIVAGHTRSNNGQVHGNHATGESDFWVLKLTRTGSIQWQKCLGGSFDETAFSIQQTTDNGYIVAGQASSIDGQVTNNHGLIDVWVVKLDANGNLV